VGTLLAVLPLRKSPAIGESELYGRHLLSYLIADRKGNEVLLSPGTRSIESIEITSFAGRGPYHISTILDFNMGMLLTPKPLDSCDHLLVRLPASSCPHMGLVVLLECQK
jgi:hypothetical protein